MQPRKQPKVHKYSRKRRRISSPGHTILSIGVTFLVAGAIGVVGYSIAKPILQYSQGKGQQTTEATSSIESNAETVETAYSTEATTTETECTTEPMATQQVGSGVVLPAESLASASALSEALTEARNRAPEGTFLVLPLKQQGGAIAYATEVPLAQQAGAVEGSLSLEEIVSMVTEEGWVPVAQCSLLYDNLLPDADASAGYTVSSGDRWLDNKKTNGGKAWASPFSTVTIGYLEDLTAEMVQAGFAEIVYTDAVFPNFRETDLEYIGETVQRADRNQALIQLVNNLAQTAGSVPVLLEVDAAGVLDGTEEVFVPEELDVSGVVLDLDGEENVALSEVLPQLSEKAGTLPLWIAADGATEPLDSFLNEKEIAGYFLK